MTDPFAIALISAVSGAVVGAGIAGFTAWYTARYAFAEQEKATQRRAAQDKQMLVYNVTTLLHQEIEHNLAMLRNLRDKIEIGLEGGNDELTFQRRARFITEPAPQWGRLMFESQASHLPEALASDVIRQVFEFYTRLGNLTELRALLTEKAPAHLVDDFNGWKEERRLGKSSPFEEMSFRPSVLQFNHDTTDLWNRADGIMNELLSRGNPVPELPEPVLAPIPAPIARWGRIVGRLPKWRGSR